MYEMIFNRIVASVIAVIALFILTRMMGKKQIAQLNFFDYVIGISIGSIASEYAVVRDIHISEGLTALITFTVFSFVFSYISMKSYAGRKIMDGVPVTIIENGKIVFRNLRKTKMNINDFLEECRQKNIFDIAEIEFAILETSGRLSVQLKSQNRPLTPKDMQISTIYEGLCINVVIDGKIIADNLTSINLNEDWLNAELSKQCITGYSNILLAYVDTSGALHTHIKQ
ncbi:MAG: DUF421 domain-containing protein [Defluviitaleaceae bacterium]|nr:DUF421 domain-containing protein [Defluviitaleaceae bacterium]